MSCDRVDNAVFMTNNPSSGWSSPISTGGNPLLYFNIPNVESWYPMILLVILQLVGFRLANETIPDSSHSISRTWTVSQQTLSELCLREVCKKTLHTSAYLAYFLLTLLYAMAQHTSVRTGQQPPFQNTRPPIFYRCYCWIVTMTMWVKIPFLFHYTGWFIGLVYRDSSIGLLESPIYFG